MSYLVIIIISSIILSAFFSGMEMAFVSSNKLKIELDKKLGFFSAKLMSHFSKNQSRFISAMLVGNNIALVVYGVFMAIFLEPYIATIIESELGVFVIQTIISTLVILVTAEFLPKAIFRINPNRLLNIFAIPVSAIYYLLYPIVSFSMFLANAALKLFGLESKEEDLTFGMIDLDHFLKEEASKVEDDSQLETEVQIFQNALDFSKVKARECMIPRTEIEALDETSDLVELNSRFIETGYSKILIYRESIDNIIGYIHSFEMFKKPKNIKEITSPISVIPETMPANEILEYFTKEKKSIAVVVDEFGGTSGMVTIEDVVEELFGDIEDEHDNEDLVERKIGAEEFIFSARLEIDYLNEKYKLVLPESEDYETLAGYIIHLHESIPTRNEIIISGNFRFIIRGVTNNRIDLVQLQKVDNEEN